MMKKNMIKKMRLFIKFCLFALSINTYAYDFNDIFDAIRDEIELAYHSTTYDAFFDHVEELFRDGVLPHDSNDPQPFLKTKEGFEPCEIFKQFAEGFKGAENCCGNCPLRIWAIYALYLTEYAAQRAWNGKAAENEEIVGNVLELFEHDKENLLQNASYEWFFSYANRLAIALTPLSKRKFYNNINTHYDHYSDLLAESIDEEWQDHKKFCEACDSLGDELTKKFVSPMGLTRHFPFVMLPFPFELTIEDLVNYAPTNENNFWLIGLSFQPIFADGIYMEPFLFFMHDQQHFNIWHWSLFSSYWINEEGLDENRCCITSWNCAVQGRNLYLEALERLRYMQAESVEEDPEQRKMNSFFAFDFAHENRLDISCRLYCLISYERAAESHLYGKAGSLRNPHYYLGSLSDSLQALAQEGNRDLFARVFLQHLEKFSQTFKSLHDQLPQENKLVQKIIGYLERNQNFSPTRGMIYFDPGAYPSLNNTYALVPEEYKLGKEFFRVWFFPPKPFWDGPGKLSFYTNLF